MRKVMARWFRWPVVGALVFLALAAGIAYAAIPAAGGVYTACRLNGVGTIRLIDTSLPASNPLSRCSSLETKFAFNAQGQQGMPGPKGDTGAQGVKGDKGDQGPAGASDVDAYVSYTALGTQTSPGVAVTNPAPGVYTVTLPSTFSKAISCAVVVSLNEDGTQPAIIRANEEFPLFGDGRNIHVAVRQASDGALVDRIWSMVVLGCQVP
jgi:hypothetical protein